MENVTTKKDQKSFWSFHATIEKFSKDTISLIKKIMGAWYTAQLMGIPKTEYILKNLFLSEYPR